MTTMSHAAAEQLLADIAEHVIAGTGAQHRLQPADGDTPSVWLFRNPTGSDATVRLTWAEEALQLHLLAGGAWTTDLDTTPAGVTSAASVTFRNVTATMVAAAIIDVLL